MYVYVCYRYTNYDVSECLAMKKKDERKLHVEEMLS
jgi:hypothetical protein